MLNDSILRKKLEDPLSSALYKSFDQDSTISLSKATDKLIEANDKADDSFYKMLEEVQKIRDRN